jgi:hypothetical protein
MLGFELFLLGLVGWSLTWLWLLLLSVPAMIWLLRREQWHLRRRMVVFLDEMAQAMGLKRLDESEATASESARASIELGASR